MRELFVTALAIGLSTAMGAVIGLFIRKVPHKFNDAVLGGAAGIMLAAAILGLIQPAIHTETPHAVVLTVLGIFAGAFAVSILDKILPHLHRIAGIDQEDHAGNKGIDKILLFVFAIGMHKFPEGLAAGVSFGTNDPGDVLMVTASISLQNVPEAMVIVAPLLAAGATVKRTLLIALGIGFIGMAGTLTGYALISITTAVLPFILAFAGGTMLYVISDEVIPETHAHGFEKLATYSIITGFTIVLVMQKFLG